MRRQPATFAALLGSILLLAACDISVRPAPTPTPRSPDATVSASADPTTAVYTTTIPAGSDRLVQINVPGGASGQALYVELDASIGLEVFSGSRSRIASSSSPAYFARGTAGLSAAGLEAQAINTDVACRGSCVILDGGSDTTFYALIRNSSGASRSVQLFAFYEAYSDEFEPSNNRTDTAPSLQITNSLGESGAIERLGDVDFWRVTQAGNLRFTAPSATIDLRAAVVDSNNVQVSQTFVPGSDIFMQVGEYLRVWAIDERAAASGNSGYQLTYAN